MHVIKVLYTVGVTFNVCDKGVVYSRSYLQCM